MDSNMGTEWYILAPVVGVAAAATLIFSYGFKRVSEPPINYQLLDERKTSSNKRKADKVKIVRPNNKKPTQNGQIANGYTASKHKPADKPLEVKTEPKKAAESKLKKGKQETVAPTETEDSTNGTWIQVPTRSEKKLRRKTGTPEVTDMSSVESTPVHQPKEVVSDPIVEPVKQVDEEPPKEETIMKPNDDEEAPRPKAKKASKSSKAKQASKDRTDVMSEPLVEPLRVEEIPAVAGKVDGPITKEATTTVPSLVEEKVPSRPSEVIINDKPELTEAVDDSKEVWQETKTLKKKKKVRRD